MKRFLTLLLLLLPFISNAQDGWTCELLPPDPLFDQKEPRNQYIYEDAQGILTIFTTQEEGRTPIEVYVECKEGAFRSGAIYDQSLIIGFYDEHKNYLKKEEIMPFSFARGTHNAISIPSDTRENLLEHLRNGGYVRFYARKEGTRHAFDFVVPKINVPTKPGFNL